MLMATPPAARIRAMVAASRTEIEPVGSVTPGAVIPGSVIQRDLVAKAAQVPDREAGAAQFAPEARDVELDGVQADFLAVEGEQLLEDALLRHHPATIEHQDFQHAELPARELQRGACNACRPPGR